MILTDMIVTNEFLIGNHVLWLIKELCFIKELWYFLRFTLNNQCFYLIIFTWVQTSTIVTSGKITLKQPVGKSTYKSDHSGVD